MEVCHEGAEHVVDRDQEQGQRLGYPHRRRVHAQLGPLGVAAEHEVIRPEQKLREDSSRRTGGPVPEQLADLPRLRGQRGEVPRLPLPHQPRGRRGQHPGQRVRQDAHADRLRHEPPEHHQQQPSHGLARPVDRKRVAHDLQAAGSTQVHLDQGHERQRQGRRAKRGPASVSCPERPGQGARPQEDQDTGRDAHRPGDDCRPVEHRANASGLAFPQVDGHAPHRRHVHPEPGRGAGDEGELGGQRDRTERGRAGRPEGPRNQDVRGERGRDEHRKPRDVLTGAREDREVIAEPLVRQRYMDGASQALDGSHRRVMGPAASLRAEQARAGHPTLSPIPGIEPRPRLEYPAVEAGEGGLRGRIPAANHAPQHQGASTACMDPGRRQLHQLVRFLRCHLPCAVPD